MSGPKMGTSGASGSSVVERLLGRENYSSWKFAMKAYLTHDELWDVVVEQPQASEADNSWKKRDQKAHSRIVLSVDKINYSHIRDTKTAAEAWLALESAFEDSGLTRRVGLLKVLVTTTLEKCRSIDDYCDRIITTAYKLNEMKFPVTDEWVGTLLLAGLPERYRPMIMALENSGIKITGDCVKVKLLQEIKMEDGSNSEGTALYSKSQGHRKVVRCFKCNKLNHIAKFCNSESDKNKNSIQRREHKKETLGKNQGEKRAFLAADPQDGQSEHSWYLDSCASAHITRDETKLRNLKACNSTVTGANGGQLTAKASGSVDLIFRVNNEVVEAEASDVLHISNSTVNLLSVSKIVSKGNKVCFNGKGGFVYDKNGNLIAKAELENGIYCLSTVDSNETSYYAADQQVCLWHRRLGHLNRKGMLQLAKVSRGMSGDIVSKDPCEFCVMGKHSRLPFKVSGKRSQGILDLVHTDLCGPMEVPSIGGSRYFLIFVDDCSRYTFVYFLREKSEVKDRFQEYKSLVEKQTGRVIKVLRSDNGREYVNGDMQKYLSSQGIVHQTTVRHSPQQNGVAERTNRTLVEKARTMLLDANLPKQYWAEATLTATYVTN